MGLTQTWSPLFRSSVRQKGRQYQQGGKVKRLSPAPGEFASAEVEGTRTYHVRILENGSSLKAECTCPFFSGGEYCKHIWATIVELEQNPSINGANGTSTTEAMSELNPSLPKARKRASDAPLSKPHQRQPKWMDQLELLRLLTESGATAPIIERAPLPPLHQICYVVNVADSQRCDQLVLELRYRIPQRTGWGRLKRCKLNGRMVSQVSDPEDRQILLMLLGNHPVDRYLDPYSIEYETRQAHDRFVVRPELARHLLQRLVQTKRAFVQIDKNTVAPLRWDAPAAAPETDTASGAPRPPASPSDLAWTPFLVVEQENGHLEAKLELRRGNQRLDVNAPALVAGAREGVMLHGTTAAAFDDAGAARWVSQFRESPRLTDRKDRAIRVPLSDARRFFERLYSMPQLPPVLLPEQFAEVEQAVTPVPHLEISSPLERSARGASFGKGNLVARVWLAYADQRVPPLQGGRFIPVTTDKDVPLQVIRRDLDAEQRAVELLARLGFQIGASGAAGDMRLPTRLMPYAAAELLRQGWVVLAEQSVLRKPATPRFKVTSGVDWFELRGGVTYETANGSFEVSLPDILAAARDGRKTITLGDGSQGLLPEDWLKQHGLLAAMAEQEGDHLRFKLTQAALLDAMLRQQPVVDLDERFLETRRRLEEFAGVKAIEPAPSFQGHLRPYQGEGLGWLHFLHWFGMGGVLADDMGLGKTVQVLALLDRRRQERADRANGIVPTDPNLAGSISTGPSLIVVPSSVVFNWMDEAARFAPQLKVMAYTGAERKSLREAFITHDLIVTSYALLRRDIQELSEKEFDYVVLDEAQAIKNPTSQGAKAARLLRANHRLALTGTPIENHLGDLWSIFEFLNPGMLGSGTRFAEMIREGAYDSDAPGEGLVAGDAVEALEPVAGAEPAESTETPAIEDDTQGVQETEVSTPAVGTASQSASVAVAYALRPFILRRTKKQVIDDLPEKTEQTIVCEMEEPQRKLYREMLEYYRSNLLGQFQAAGIGAGDSIFRGPAAGAPAGASGPATPGAAGTPMVVLEALLRLRQVACHPGLIDDKRADDASAKLESLLESLQELVEEGHKALVFSQFVKMLTLVRKRLDSAGLPYEYLDGQTRDRKERVDHFQTDPKCPIFLISLKAGGLGLNLTAADYVFILDPWWNPAVEAQAVDRAHRIGQTRHVFAYRLVCRDTIEQRILELQERKRKLAEAIIGGQENLLRTLTRADLEHLLS